jgi:hypothetical protein
LIKYFEEDYKNTDNKDLISLLEELQDSDIKEQEQFFNEFINKAALGNKELEDIVLIAARV